MENKKIEVSRLAFADGLRGIAAMWVVLYHLAEGHHMDLLLAKLPDFLRASLFNAGGLGVAIFFVLSGYVMAYTMRQTEVNLSVAGNFIVRRLVRLSPPYYFAMLVSIFFMWLKMRFSGAQVTMPNAQSIVEHLFYLEDFLKSPVINTAFWTLSVEVQFYIAFAMLVLSADWLEKKFQWDHARFYVTLFAAAVALLWACQWILTPLWQGGFIGFWYSFLLGMMVCWAKTASDGRFQKLSYVYIALIFLSAVVTQQMFSAAAALTATLLFYAGQKDYMGTWLNGRSLQTIGLISYSLYLLHNPITGATANVVRRALPSGVVTDAVIFVAAITACLIAAWIAYRVIELPSIRWSRKVTQ